MSVESRLAQLLRELFNDDELVVTDETTAGDVPGWDSLANVNLVFSVEREFGIELADSDLGEFANVGALRRAIDQALAAKGGP